MSVTGVAQSAQLTGQPSQLGPGGPLAATQGLPPGVPRQGAPAARRRRAQHGGGHWSCTGIAHRAPNRATFDPMAS